MSPLVCLTLSNLFSISPPNLFYPSHTKVVSSKVELIGNTVLIVSNTVGHSSYRKETLHIEKRPNVVLNDDCNAVLSYN